MDAGYRAIPTRWRGCLFRSRLEARWAVYFDAIGLAWEYEPQGFDLGGVAYLPDFYLPQVQAFAEVKPADIGSADLDAAFDKLMKLARATGRVCVMLVGPPDAKPYDCIDPRLDDCIDGYCTDAIIDPQYVHEQRFFMSTGGERLDHDPEIVAAVAAARSERFDR